jgi:hypothetical protein
LDDRPTALRAKAFYNAVRPKRTGPISTYRELTDGQPPRYCRKAARDACHRNLRGKLWWQFSCYQRYRPIRRHPSLLWQRIPLLLKEFQVDDRHDGGELSLPETAPSNGFTVAMPTRPACAATMTAAIPGCNAHCTVVTSDDRRTRFNLAVARYRRDPLRCDGVLRNRAKSINCPRIRQLAKNKNLLIMRRL